MIRSPLFYPLARGMDNEAGGAADLQTDVMRFMAILSLCLMAIFALLQTLPPEPVAAASSAPVAPKPDTEAKPETEPPAKPEAKPVLVKQPPAKRLTPSATQTVSIKPVPKPTTTLPIQYARVAVPSATPEQPPVPPDDAPAGFTLRFDSDHVLTELVARNAVGLYAITDEQALRMTLNRDKAEFWSASLPQQYHEMDSSTVPKAVLNALQLMRGGDQPGTRWGVTLTSSMSRKLGQLMRDNRSGSLIIGVDGDLRLEP